MGRRQVKPTVDQRLSLDAIQSGQAVRARALAAAGKKDWSGRALLALANLPWLILLLLWWLA